MAKKGGFQIELIPNMYELGLFKKSLSSTKRLRITTLIAVIGLCVVFGGVGYFIKYISSWFWLNVILIILAYICTLVVGLLLALTIGDVIFTGPWREKMMRGSKYIPDDLNEQKALMKNKNIYFIFVWLISIIILGVGCDLVTGGNIRWYQSVGSSIVMLRSDDPNDRIVLMRSLSKLYYSDMWKDNDVKKAVIDHIEDDNNEVSALAIYISGRAKYIDSVDALVWLIQNENADEHVKSEAAVAIGRIEWKKARGALITEMRKAFASHPDSHEFVPSLFYAFYEMKDSAASYEVIQILQTCLENKNCSEEIYQYGFFYLKSMKLPEASELSFKYIESDMPQNIRCYAIDSLRFASKKSDVPRMKQEFEKTPSDLMCQVVYRKYHEEAAIILFEEDPQRALYVRAVGNYMDENDYDWIWMVGSNESEKDVTRKVAEIYTRAMIEKRAHK